MNRLERLYAITEELRRRAPGIVSAATLAEHFGVTQRTIERDLAALREAGVPLDGAPGRGGGVSVDRRASRVIFSLSAGEVTALLLAAAATEGMPYGDAGRSATRRLLDSLAPATRVEVDSLRSRIRAVAPDAPGGSALVRRTLEEAVREGRVVNVTYVDRNDVRTTRAVEAVGFYGGADGWYLIGWCRLRLGGRVFRLDRIERAQRTSERFVPRDVDETLGWVPGQVVIPG
jgi:predicted DNA-binding transcriptional regulator YafY